MQSKAKSFPSDTAMNFILLIFASLRRHTCLRPGYQRTTSYVECFASASLCSSVDTHHLNVSVLEIIRYYRITRSLAQKASSN